MRQSSKAFRGLLRICSDAVPGFFLFFAAKNVPVMFLDDPDRIPDTAYLPPLLMVVLVLAMVLVIELDPERVGIVVFPDHPAMAGIT